ncbi:CLUMA_CG011325, isoform A [Clunio marinus]|uniref:CLUMA_CG011325, isoform A n=1 Tax=Clunio marinus TaxID=568069 RepID=A0A1J1IHM4_9DIPT|nr:CLUMA_CG011325, isoform A [Clunio marinus]
MKLLMITLCSIWNRLFLCKLLLYAMEQVASSFLFDCSSKAALDSIQNVSLSQQKLKKNLPES